MPLTPFHLGPTFLIATIFPRQINLTSILLASTIIDIRTVYCFLNSCHLHGPLHTYIGATLFALAVALFVFILRKNLETVLKKIRFQNSFSKRSIILGALIGSWSHVFLDSFMHHDITPFWPVTENPFLQLINNKTNYEITIICSVLGVGVYFYRGYKSKSQK